MKTTFSLIFIGILALSSCVSKKKFDQEAAARQKAQSDLSHLRQESSADKKKLEGRIAELEKTLAEKTKNCDGIQSSLNALQKNFNELQASYDELLTLNKDLKEQVSENKRQLSERLATKEEELRKKELELKELEARLRQDILDREKRVKELEDALAERDRRARELRESLLKALAGFNTSDLTVYEKDGKVYVSLSQNLLFAKGSSKLDTKGVSALGKLAAVLNKPESMDINILVEGHTDSDGDDKLNWQLSSERSLAIVQTLIDNKVGADRLTAAGRGKHSPIAPNDTEANKAKNRRTDIILTPKLDELFKVLNGN